MKLEDSKRVSTVAKYWFVGGGAREVGPAKNEPSIAAKVYGVTKFKTRVANRWKSVAKTLA